MRALFLALLLLAPALARASTWDTYVRIGSIWVTDPGFDLVSEGDAMPRVELGAGWAADPEDRLLFEVGYAYSSTTAPLFDSLDASLGLHGFQGSALYRLPVARAHRLLFRGTAAYELATLEIEPFISDVAGQLALEASTGWELQLPLARGSDPYATHFAFNTEVGYGLRPFAAHFSDGIDVGEVDLSAWILRFGATMRF